MASATVTQFSTIATTSQAFRSYLLWGSAGIGLVYGFLRDAKLSKSVAAKREQDIKQADLDIFNQARDAYAAMKAAQLPKDTSGVITDPNSPQFDLEKLINHWAEESNH